MPDRFSSVPDLLLERYALNELSAAEKRAIEARLATDPALQQRLDALRASNSAVLDSHPPESLARRLQDRMRREKFEREIHAAQSEKTFRVPFGARSALASLMIAALVAVPAWKVLQENGTSGTGIQVVSEEGIPQIIGEGSTAEPPAQTSSGHVEMHPVGKPETIGGNPAGSVTEEPADPSENPGENVSEPTRLKGIDPRLALFRKTGQGAVPMRPGETAGPGEFLRIGYHAAGFDFGAIFSVDGNGNVTRHWPVKGDKSAHLQNGEVLLPIAFELDAAPAFERFYLVVADHPFALTPLLAPLHEGIDSVRALPLPREARIVRFEILKESGI